jgi:hypothetical protein
VINTIPYHEISKCQTLNNWFGGVQDTSQESWEYLNTTGIAGTQITEMLKIYAVMPEGLSDEAMQEELRKRGLTLDKSTVSARRNDINHHHRLWCEKNHLFGDSLIKGFPTRIINSTGRSAIAWGLSRYMKVIGEVVL